MQAGQISTFPVLTQRALPRPAVTVPAAGIAAPRDQVMLDPNPPPTDRQEGMKPSILVRAMFDLLLEKISPFPRKRFYPGYDATVQQLRDLNARYPDKTLLKSIGKSYEGRDIWALKITSGAQGDTSGKPGVVFTGLHHAREWATVQSSLNLAGALLEGYGQDPSMTRRVDDAETWIIPIVNPDGYEYTRERDKNWRKNRSPQADGNFGVDINRNYYDPNHPELYRQSDDSPQSCHDDVGASDDPSSISYRGTSGSSELEVQATLGFELGHPNVVGVLDHHSFGEMILRPQTSVVTSDARRRNYDTIGARMKAAQHRSYTYIASDQLYPTTGDSSACLEVNGRYAMVIEMGNTFRPAGRAIRHVTREVVAADLSFLDSMVEIAGSTSNARSNTDVGVSALARGDHDPDPHAN